MRLREQRFEDYAGVVAVLGRNGLRSPSPDQWAYFWNASPHREQLDHIPFGWLLEHETDGVVGTFRNIAFLYEWNCKPVRVVVASAWAVDRAYRRQSLMLAKAYFNQTGADVLLNTTAVLETSGKAFLAFRAARVPQPTYTTRMLWITGYQGFSAHYLRQRRIPAANLLRYPVGLGAWFSELSRRSARAADRVRQVDSFDDRFDRFWAIERQRRDRLQAIRDAATLRWRFALERERPFVAVLESGKDIDGYAVCVRRDQDGLRRLEVVDLQVRDEDSSLMRTLVDGALGLARDQDIHLVALTGFGEAKRQALATLRPHCKAVSGWPLYYKAVAHDLVRPLESPEAWDLSLYDGDALWSGMFESSKNSSATAETEDTER
jgi:hypothetical protein